MGINPDLFYCAVRIVGDVELVDGDGTKLGTTRGVIGTGFCMDADGHKYLLTADHVLEEQTNVEVELPDPGNPGSMYPAAVATDWRRPLDEVDLAICPLNSIDFVAPVAVPGLEMAMLSKLGPGDTLHYIGILDPLDRPMLRGGTVGAVDQEGIDHAGGYVYPAHLVDCRSYEGFSGSPCFLVSEFSRIDEPFKFPEAFRPDVGVFGDTMPLYALAGMFTEHLDDERPDGRVSRYGVGIMIRSQEIGEALMSEDFQRERADWDRGGDAATTQGPRPRSARNRKRVVRKVEPNEYENFENLARELVQTPKPAGEDPKE